MISQLSEIVSEKFSTTFDAELVTQEVTSKLLEAVFKAIAVKAKLSKGFRAYLFHDLGQGTEPWNARIVFRTRDNAICRHLIIEDGKIRDGKGDISGADASFILRDVAALKKMLLSAPEDSIIMMFRNELTFEGNMSVITRFSFLLERLLAKKKPGFSPEYDSLYEQKISVTPKPAAMKKCDEVMYLDDPAFSDWDIRDFPRLERFVSDFFSTKPSISTERPRILTEYFKRTGFETHPDGKSRIPELRQAQAFSHLMKNKRPIIRDNDLIAGTTTDKKVGIIVYPDCGGSFIWPELYTIHNRKLNPYNITEEDRHILNSEVFPFWMNRNVREKARKKGDEPTCLSLDSRFVLYFQWKAHALSHTIPDFDTVLNHGLSKISKEAEALESKTQDEKAQIFYRSVQASIEGVLEYAEHLAEACDRLAKHCKNSKRKSELEKLAAICRKVPVQPAETLDEAVNSIWITFVAVHMENTNAAMSIGRLDTILQPFFIADMEKCRDDDERQATIKHAVDLLGCLFMRCTDHLPQVADLGNILFGGSSSDQAITVGGVNKDGSNAVCDMTFVILKAAEMVKMRDPNLNARFHDGVNSEAYFRRLCELNLLTGSTPSIHNDKAVIATLEHQNFTTEDARDWAAVGCVEPTSNGRHFGNSSSMMVNLVAPLEMALYDGYHPLCDEVIGPHTGNIEKFDDFESFYQAYLEQLHYLTEKSAEANDLLGEIHREVRPTPFLSSVMEGCLKKGKDVVDGGAKYNGSGMGLVGISDVVDSLMTIKKLVFEEKRLTFDELIKALQDNFEGHEALHARIMNHVPKFGSGDQESIDMANEVLEKTYEFYHSYPHYRNGHYNPGYWSMSNHVAFGVLSGALPSGRRRYAPFTPGMTPAPTTRESIVRQIQTVASMNSKKMPNNMAFNVKVVPDPKDSEEKTLDTLCAYAKTYIELGGMQMQFNVISTDVMKDAMKHPENHRNLMVRISGYNAYFVELNRDLQLELISRTEHSTKN